MMKKMYKITRAIDGKESGTLYKFPYIRDARERLNKIAAACRGEISEKTRNSFTAIQHGRIFHFAIIK